MSVAAGIICSKSYAGFLPGWLESVEGLNRAPDEVVAVTDVPRKQFPSWVRTVKPPQREFEWCAWRNHLAASCADHDYLSWVDVDDRYRPVALDGCDEWSTDVVAFGMAYEGPSGYAEWHPVTDTSVIGAGLVNQVPNGSPVRTAWALRSPWTMDFWPYSDWGFWVQAACRGATFRWTGRVDFDYRWHADTPTETDDVRARLQAWRAAEGYA